MEFIDLTDGDSQPRAKIAQTDEAISRTLERYTEEANTAGTCCVCVRVPHPPVC
jgi:hypothetical protein